MTGDFKFTITNADDPTQYIELKYTSKNSDAEPNILMCVDYYCGDVVYYRAKMGNNNNYVSWNDYDIKGFPLRTGFNSNTNLTNGIKLVWTQDEEFKDVLTVQFLGATNWNGGGAGQWKDTLQCDGGDTSSRTYSGTACSVPYFTSKNYTISFSSNWSTGTDIVFTSVNGQSLAGVTDFTVSDI